MESAACLKQHLTPIAGLLLLGDASYVKNALAEARRDIRARTRLSALPPRVRDLAAKAPVKLY